jgi:hypothetical protein
MYTNFFPKIAYDKNVEKYGETREATEDNTAHSLCMADK